MNTKYYTSGQFAGKAGVSVRTIRFYDKENILKPSYVNENGKRFYSDEDFARLQQVLLLKYLGFSLEDIRGITVSDTDSHLLLNSLRIQSKLIADKIEQMQLVAQTINDTTAAIEKNNSVDWSSMLDLIHLTSMENTLRTQYLNANNISARINLHALYSQNKQGWFPWIYEMLNITEDMNILELGCGNGALWTENVSRLSHSVDVTLSDISEGMLRDARRLLSEATPTSSVFSYAAFDCHSIPYEDNSFDLVIANHLLFYCDDIDKVCSEVARVLKPDGRFICSTYGSGHMKEISRLVQEFDNRVVLSAESLYDRFGLDNGESILSKHFDRITKHIYDDCLVVDKPEPLIEYILSCHGNQNQYLSDRYKDFRKFMSEKTKKALKISKEAGLFICTPIKT
ncbi:MAG: methyltransferase domain-containing protein [Lachnospira sp.]|nr:methyltransferase domain-containing protein [Lachnospira sp.]